MTCKKARKTKQQSNLEDSEALLDLLSKKKLPEKMVNLGVGQKCKKSWVKHDLMGQVFAHWTVLTQAPHNKWHAAMWHCVCNCGVTRVLPASALIQGRSKSCGGCGCVKKGAPASHGLFGTQRYQLWKGAKRRAKENRLPFSIKVTDIPEIPDKCPILGIPLTKGKNHKYKPGSASLDKIIAKRGYVPGNIQVISHRANAIKQDATWREISLVANYMKKLCKKL